MPRKVPEVIDAKPRLKSHRRMPLLSSGTLNLTIFSKVLVNIQADCGWEIPTNCGKSLLGLDPKLRSWGDT